MAWQWRGIPWKTFPFSCVNEESWSWNGMLTLSRTRGPWLGLAGRRLEQLLACIKKGRRSKDSVSLLYKIGYDIMKKY